MRYKELLEYKRDITSNNYGEKLLSKLLDDKSFIRVLQTEYTTAIDSNYREIEGWFDNWINENKDTVIDFALRTIESKDPSANKQYTQWVVMRYVDNSISMFEDILTTIETLLRKYHELKVHRVEIPPQFSDIGQIKYKVNVTNFFQNITRIYNEWEMKRGIDKKKLTKGNAKVVFDNEEVRVIIPEDRQAACYYGQGTQWCTAATTSANYFDEYNKDGSMYILLPTKPQYKGEKYQLHFNSQQYMDETDTQRDLHSIIDERFRGSGLLEFFRKKEPTINNLIQFAPEGLLMDVVQSIHEYVGSEVVGDMIHEWEMDDAYYYTWLTDEGYADDDEVSDDAPNYAEYNTEVGDFMEAVGHLLNLNKDELDDISTYYTEETESVPVIKDIAELIAWNMKDEAGSYEFGGSIEDVANEMERHLEVKVQWGNDGQPLGFQLVHISMTREKDDRAGNGLTKRKEHVVSKKDYT